MDMIIPTISFEELLEIAKKSMKYDVNSFDASFNYEELDVIKEVCELWNTNNTSLYKAASFEFKHLLFESDMDIEFFNSSINECIRVEADKFNNLFIIFMKSMDNYLKEPWEVYDVNGTIYHRITNLNSDGDLKQHAYDSLLILQELYENFLGNKTNIYDFLFKKIENIEQIMHKIALK